MKRPPKKTSAKNPAQAAAHPWSEKPVFPMRINKYLAWKKHATRRGGDALIEKGQVFINGRRAVLGDKVTEKDVVEVRFRGKQPDMVYFAYNKPRGTVADAIGSDQKDAARGISLKGVFPVGHLDKDAHGLVILTNDGRITERLLSPNFTHEREYLVTTKEPLRSNFKEKMEAGVQIEDAKTKPCQVKILDDHTFQVILTEDRKHQVRRMCVALFQEVDDLERLRVLNVILGDLASGSHRKIAGAELKEFLRLLDLV